MRRQLEQGKLRVKDEHQEALWRDLMRMYERRDGEDPMGFKFRTSEAAQFDGLKRLTELEAEVYRRFGFRE